MTQLPSTHIVLVSDQPMPSLFPLLDPEIAARKALLFASPQRVIQAEWLAETLRSKGLEAEIHHLERPYDLNYLHRKFDQGITAYPEGVATNITGGNKLMSIAAYNSCKSAGQPVYYVNIDTDAMQWIYPEHWDDHPLKVTLQLETYLQSCGVTVESLTRNQHPITWVRLANDMLANRSLFLCIQKIKNSPNINDTITTLPPQQAQYVNRLLNLKILQHQANGYHYKNNEAKRFLMGGWFELAVHDAIAATHSKNGACVQDIAMNLKISWKMNTESTELLANEFDVVALINDTLYLIECKSGQNKNLDEIRKVILQLGRSRTKLGGLRGRAVLVSRLAISASLEARCEDNQVDTLFTHGLSFTHFQTKIQQIIGGHAS